MDIARERSTKYEGKRSFSKSDPKRSKIVDLEVAGVHDKAHALQRWAQASKNMMQDVHNILLIDFVGHVDAIASDAPSAFEQARTAWNNRRREVMNDFLISL